MNYLIKLRKLLDKQTQVKLLGLMVFSVFLSIIEVAGISAIMPFIDIAMNFNTIHSNQYYQWLYSFFEYESDVNFAITFGLVLFGFYLFRGGVNLMHSYALAQFSENLYAHITKQLFKVYLQMPYQIFTTKNSSYLTKSIITEAALMAAVIRSVLIMLSEIFVVLFLYILMLISSWEITLIFTIVIIIKMIFLTKKISKKIKKVGVTRATVQAEFYEVINKVFGNFEHVKLQDSKRLQEIHIDFLTKINMYAKANTIFNFLLNVPRLFIETVGFSLIIFLLIVLLYLNKSDISYILPVLTLFVLALYRLLPSVNRIISGYNMLMYYHKSIDIIEEDLKIPQENLKDQVVEFKKNIELKGVGFSYQNKIVLKSIGLTIQKGEKVAFVGGSGSGKSTLAALIIGLHRPEKGEIKVDGTLIDESNIQHWRSQIGYIPQQVYLFDGTIEENVCFGRSVKQVHLKKVLKQANIFDFLQTKQGVNTLVGEGGVQLSGGQRQRIGIARALYGQSEILVLDEATSALDSETEEKIMNEIYEIGKDKTLIIIAHRLSTIQGCDKVFKLDNGAIGSK